MDLSATRSVRTPVSYFIMSFMTECPSTNGKSLFQKNVNPLRVKTFNSTTQKNHWLENIFDIFCYILISPV